MIRDRIWAIGRYLQLLGMTVLLWLASGSGWILGLAVLVVLIPPVSLLSNLYVRKHIRGRIIMLTTAAKGAACEGTIRLENRSFLPAAKLRCRLGMINDLTREETVLEFTSGLGPGVGCDREFSLESRYCGRIYVHVQSVAILDYFGLFSLRVPMKADARITVLPELFSCDVTLAPVAAASDESQASCRGDDRTEVFQLREYRSGDDIRQIHWKLSSKLDSLILREPGQSISRSLLVFWDKRRETTPENMDAMAEVTASVCQALCDSGITFDLCWTEKEEPELRQIRDADTLLQTIPALVTQTGSAECREPDTGEYGRVIQITPNPPDEYDEKTVCLICGEGDLDDGRNIGFFPGNYRGKLERLEL